MFGKTSSLAHDLITIKVTSYQGYWIEYYLIRNKKASIQTRIAQTVGYKSLILHVVHSTYFRQSYKYPNYKQNRTKCQGVTI